MKVVWLIMQALQEALSVAGKRLHSQIARDIPQAPCVVGQYLPVCSCNDDNEDRKCCGPKNLNDFTCCKSNRREEKRSASIHTHSLKCGSSVWAAAVATKNHEGGNVPKLLHVVVEGRQYYASTHVSVCFSQYVDSSWDHLGQQDVQCRDLLVAHILWVTIWNPDMLMLQACQSMFCSHQSLLMVSYTSVRVLATSQLTRNCFLR